MEHFCNSLNTININYVNIIYVNANLVVNFFIYDNNEVTFISSLQITYSPETRNILNCPFSHLKMWFIAKTKSLKLYYAVHITEAGWVLQNVNQGKYIIII